MAGADAGKLKADLRDEAMAFMAASWADLVTWVDSFKSYRQILARCAAHPLRDRSADRAAESLDNYVDMLLNVITADPR